MEELINLLENYWVIKEKDKEMYYRVRDKVDNFKDFIIEKLGFNIIINKDFVKLEKLPGNAESWMGITEFDEITEYVFFLIILIFLEDKGKEEQFILPQLTEFVRFNYPEENKIDWTIYKHRKSFIRVLKFCENLGIIRVNFGDENQFVSNMVEEVLYESTGLSRYIVQNFPTDIYKCNSYKDIENDGLNVEEKNKGVIRRQRVYRKLVLSPVFYNDDVEGYNYIKNFRNIVENDFDKYLDSNLHVHKNGAVMIVRNEKLYKDLFPKNTSLSDIVLQFNALIVEKLKNSELEAATDDTIILTRTDLKYMIKELYDRNKLGWSKEYREASQEILTKDILKFMQGFNMLQPMHEYYYKVYPITGKIIGEYSKEFYIKLKEETERNEGQQMDGE